MSNSDFDPIWRGTRATTERYDSPRITRSATGWRAIRVYEGVYTDLLKAAPAAGSKMADTGAMQVEEAEIVPAGGGLGVMTVTLASDSLGGIDSDPDPVYEIEWIEVQKDITRHPRYQTGGASALTEDQFKLLKKARMGDETAIASIKKTNSDALAEIWAKILAGNEDYVEYIPLVTESTTTRSRPTDTNSGAGFIDAPPASAGYPQGWQWLRTAAPTTRQGLKWVKRRQWTGAKKIDHDLYS